MLTPTRVAASFVLATVALAANFSGAPAQTDDYPSRPVRIIVGFGPGSTADYSARTVAQKLSLKFGQQFVVESRAGAGSNLAAEYVARAPKDGYTLLMGTVANTINATISKLNFDFAKDFAPVALGHHGAEHPGGASLDRLPHRRRPGGGGEARADDVRLLRRRQRAARLRRAAQYLRPASSSRMCPTPAARSRSPTCWPAASR